MGEFLLSILGINAENEIIYTRSTFHARYKINSCVARYYPHGEKGRPYIRIYGRAYSEETLRDLLTTEDPNVIDLDMFSRYQRERRDEDIYTLVSQGQEAKHVAYQYKWVTPAILEACERHKARVALAKDEVMARRRPALEAMIAAMDALEHPEEVQ